MAISDDDKHNVTDEWVMELSDFIFVCMCVHVTGGKKVVLQYNLMSFSNLGVVVLHNSNDDSFIL